MSHTRGEIGTVLRSVSSWQLLAAHNTPFFRELGQGYNKKIPVSRSVGVLVIAQSYYYTGGNLLFVVKN
jgi:hypothetical protein